MHNVWYKKKPRKRYVCKTKYGVIIKRDTDFSLIHRVIPKIGSLNWLEASQIGK